MTAIREPGKINENTTLIDAYLQGVGRISAVYLIKGEKTCLIDTGTKIGANKIVQALEDLKIGPPDIIILTHSHWDHCQGIPILRSYAERNNKQIEIMASEKSIPLLRDQSFNNVYEGGPFENLTDFDVKSLKEGDIVDLGGLTLKIYEIPGHTDDHIAIFDEKNKNIFVGDGIGYKIGDNAFLPTCMPPFFNEAQYLNSIEKLKQINYETLCLNHFGYIVEEEAKTILDESVDIYKRSISLFKEHIQDIDNTNLMMDLFKREFNAVVPVFPLSSFKLKFLLGLMNFFKKITFKQPMSVGDVLFPVYLKYIIISFKSIKDIG